MTQQDYLSPAHHDEENKMQEQASQYPQPSYHSDYTQDRTYPTIPTEARREGRFLTSNWTRNKDRHLTSLCEVGCSYKDLGPELQRTTGAIDKRLDLLERRPGYTSLKTFRRRQHAYLMNTYWGPK
ncbi:hypothetical protein BDV97DRAFT_187806 [Delphinella strobiligena]|nr:hypothetical protein BDV97DRAFT_187806 [Delphinella strobiligena]